ncbi:MULTISPECIES: hypothetical protein [Clostridia]|uniref:Uncharacterized protein n=2 Tax=Clostridia TaxID=186801 RepID=A0A8I0DN64_9CLOT|nr:MULTISPECIES: hypothetical protein [Clostridia]MBC5639835.1 hypothetical protein [Clostridium lentum]MBC5654067.1 hypothetical protein [Blautia lenta]MEE0566799.1 hypothetical protein [Clostridium sp.]
MNFNKKKLSEEDIKMKYITASKHLPSNFIDLKNNLPSNYEVSIGCIGDTISGSFQC